MPRSVQYLDLQHTGIKELPKSVWSNENISYLNLRLCEYLKKLPCSRCNMEKLEKLDFNGCLRLEKLPSSCVGFLSLEELRLSDSGILEIPASIKQASRLSILELRHCERLQSIPELPVLCNVKAGQCRSLKIVSSSRTALTQGWDKPHYCYRVFTNCPKLDNNSRRNIMDDAQITIMRMATVAPLKGIYPEPNMKIESSSRTAPTQGWCKPNHRCRLHNPWAPIPIMRMATVAPFKDDILPHHHPWPQITCPGKEIPKWFSYQNEGSSVDIELCPDWFRTGLFGFALSVVLSGLSTVVRANFIVKFMGERHELFSSKCMFGFRPLEVYHHVHVWNEAFRSEEVGKNCSPEASVVFYLEFFGRPAAHGKVESCGICPLYAEDAEKFKLGHVFMSRGPKVEETKQDEPQASGSCDESEANESDDHGSEVGGTEDDSSDESEANESD